MDSTLKALLVYNCSYWGVELSGDSTLTGSFLGTDATGTSARPNGVGVSVTLRVAPGTTVIGGTSPGQGNLLSGNLAYGVLVQAGPALIIGNRIGTDVTGLGAVPNQNGIELEFAKPYGTAPPPITIGGTSPGAGNLISGNGQYGIALYGSTDVLIQGNAIGPDASGGVGLGSQRAGVETVGSARVTIGGSLAAANVIAFHTFAGVAIEGGSTRIHGVAELDLRERVWNRPRLHSQQREPDHSQRSPGRRRRPESSPEFPDPHVRRVRRGRDVRLRAA